MNFIKRILSYILIIVITISINSSRAFAEEIQKHNEKRVVRVAYPMQTYLTEIDENGDYTGYSYEYLKKVAEFANWKLEYITYPNMALNQQIIRGMEMVESGEADIIGVMLKNEKLEEKYLYADKNYGAVYTTLDVLDSNLSVNETNYMQLNPLRIAVLKTATIRNRELDTFIKNGKINCEYVYCDTVDEQIESLKNGNADAMLKVSLTFIKGLKEIAEFSPRPYYYVSSYGKEDLIEELNTAITQINMTDPYFESRLRSKYFKNTIADFSLSESEKEYVSKYPKLHVLILPQYAPFSFVNKNDELCGMSISILNDIGKKAGIDFEYHVLKENEDSTKEIASGKYEVVIGPPHSGTFAESNNLVLSQPYLESSLTMFINKSAESKPKSECVLGLLKDVPDHIGYEYKEIRYYDNIQQCLEAVNRGEADYGYGSSHVVDFYTLHNIHKNLRYLNLSGYNREVGFYVPNTEESELLSIINKYVRSMSTKDVHEYLSLALSQRDYGGIGELIQDNPFLVIGITISFLFLILLSIMLGIYNNVNKKRNEKLQIAFSAKSEFLSRMSHDMRTPMNGIIGLTGLTLEIENLPEEVSDNLSKIDESAQYLLSLINDTLDMNKIESNKIVLNKERVNLYSYFDQMISVVKLSADQKNINLIAKQSGEKVPDVNLDRVRVQQIFFNLFSNAIKFTPENGTVTIHWNNSMCSVSQVKTKLTIKDTGVGIDKDFLPKIFEPFEQEFNSTTANYVGTGLGLAIVKNLVDIMGGSISVKSEKGIGSEFFVELIFDITESQTDIESYISVSEDDLNEKRILLCEDHLLNAKIATKLLKKKGMLVDIGENGQIAVDLFLKSEVGYYDAILMDIQMPIMGGLEATEVIRKADKGDAKSIPIIAMTANAFDEDVQKSLKAGMNAHLAKPIEPNKLYETLYGFICGKENKNGCR